MSKLCPHCKSKKVGSLSDTVMCCMVCHRVFGKSQLIDDTLFDHITQSQEVLAEKLVYMTLNAGRWEWCSTLLPDKSFETKAEAISATLARLNEVYNGN